MLLFIFLYHIYIINSRIMYECVYNNYVSMYMYVGLLSIYCT